VIAMEHSHQSIEDTALVWQIGVFDAHCHPTDIMASIKDIGVMKARALIIMASRSQDQELVAQVASKYALTSKDMCDDASSCRIVPAFGWHPWFSYQLYDDRLDDINTTPSPKEHYQGVLTSSPDAEFLDSLPPPRPLSDFLLQTEERLRQHPYALVGEVGLDRAFRLPIGGFMSPPPNPSKDPDNDQSYTPGAREGRPLSPHRVSMDHQKVILKAQFELAGKLRRPVSIHSVQAHGVVFELLQQMWAGHEKPSKHQQKRRLSAAGAHTAEMDEEETNLSAPAPLPYPPRICMHSYSGPPDLLRQFLHSSVPAEIYFSFSTLVNFPESSSIKAIEVIKTVPESRILVESDFHCAGQRMDDLLADTVQRVCEIKGWSQRKGAEQLRRNWERFVFGE
jgi:Tat protein secretion system quality control protein TatD with DNase activity